ncbi:retron system putative HNH endonuclease [Neoroseomonas rubea]|uniref:retron system putative HNH endonuclease n=1 Tax=Neoroseomonas rubea TaxID=2748666 RepID=UPI001E3691FB|nr:retron system putative HNH endonuclease [Roseomonas rubea]
MKPVRGLSGPPPGLKRFCDDPSQPQNWETFGDFESGAAKQEVANALARSQRGLCCYCEATLVSGDRQVEHVVPRSDPLHGSARAVDATNMLASCKGGTERNFAVDALNDPARYLPPVRDNMSCGQRKGETIVMDPRNLPPARSIFVVAADGKILTDPSVCIEHGIDANEADKAIIDLGLNVERLRIQRAAILASLSSVPADAVVWDALARGTLLPDEGGQLRPWFTTTRSFFRELAESILAQPPQDWIAA